MIKKFNEYKDFIDDDYEEVVIPEEDYLYIDYSQIPNSGMGLYTSMDIDRDVIVATFYGEILSEEEVENRIESDDDQYFMEHPSGEIFDCKFVDGFAKYANDAEGVPSKFRNNTYIGITEDDDIALISKRKIKAGEEIFTGYGKAYWKKHAKSL